MIRLIRGRGTWVAIPLKEGNECQESFGKPLQQVVTPTMRVACLRWRHEPTGRGPRFECALIQVSPGRGVPGTSRSPIYAALCRESRRMMMLG